MKKYTITKAQQATDLGDKENPQLTAFDIEGPEEMQISDGYHTMDELYEHRIMLYIKLAKAYTQILKTSTYAYSVWRSKKHSDGQPAFGGTWFVLGIGKEAGEQITYHLPIEKWDETEFAETLEKAPEFDGHSSSDVLIRLKTL